MRLAPTSLLTGSLIDFSGSDDYTSATNGWTGIAPGTVITAAPTDAIDTTAGVPNWIGSEVVYAVNTGSSTFGVGRWVHLDKNGAILDMPATANTGRPVYLCITPFAAGNVTVQGGWLLRSGIGVALFSVAATVGPVYRGTAGNATPTAAAGSQILNATTLIAAATTFTRSVTTQTGSAIVRMARTNGCFPGQAISGTGIPGSTTILAVNPDGTSLTMSANATASNTVTGTFTPTGFGIVHIDRPFVQGQIT